MSILVDKFKFSQKENIHYYQLHFNKITVYVSCTHFHLSSSKLFKKRRILKLFKLGKRFKLDLCYLTNDSVTIQMHRPNVVNLNILHIPYINTENYL